MLIEWIGHSCFYLTAKTGKTIIIDPYGDEVGLLVPQKPADIVLITHDHFDHLNKSYLDGIKSEYTLIDKVGEYAADGIKITGINVMHDEKNGAERGTCVSFLIEADNMRILHMADVGAMPPPEYFKQIGKVDILMIPVGGVYTVGAKGALNIMDAVHANITIPMHYLVNGLTMKELASVHDFLARAQSREYDVSRLGGDVFEITADSLKKRNRIVVMECTHC
ncbi:MAG: MBL fold metallo-hydrolase [Christensenella sp.]